MGRRPTILDVAKQAGVSKSTVSLVLQGSDSVKDSTRKQVRQVMADLGYVYNRSAATLRSSSSGLIGLVINDIRNPFFTEFAASLQKSLADKGYATVIANTDEDGRFQAKTIASLIEHGVSGLVISPAYGDEENTLEALEHAAIPTIQVLRRLSETCKQFPFIAPDYEHGSALATQHLLDVGCRKIAFFGGLEGRPITRERMSGYLSVLKQKQIKPVVITGQATRSFGRTKVMELQQSNTDVDGILCFNDLVALGVLSACAENGTSVGSDMRVIGIDDIEACRDSFPALTSVSCNIPELAQQTADSLLGWINEGRQPREMTRLPVSLVTRASTLQQS